MNDHHSPANETKLSYSSASPEPLQSMDSEALSRPASTVSPFSSNRREVAAALLSYLAAWLYTFIWTSTEAYVLAWMTGFAAAFTVGVLLYNLERPSSREHWVWLGCLWLCLICGLLGHNRVWGDYIYLFVHCYAIYWVLCRSDRLLEGRSSAFLPIDAINGAIYFPFTAFFTFLRTRVLGWGLRQRRKTKNIPPHSFRYIMLALLVAAVLFGFAVYLLAQADSNFAALLPQITLWINADRLSSYFLRFLLSIPIGAYLFGLVVGTTRRESEFLQVQRDHIQSGLASLAKVPGNVWTILMGIFVALYLLFFWIQGSYLFGAFARNLPDNFTVAQYARQGFFELCIIMALNFALLWVVQYSSALPVNRNLPEKILCTALLAESILFAVTALSKLYLYISCFGFTPLRLQSLWLVCVLTVGCGCAMVSLWSSKRTIRVWIFFTGISLALLHLY